MSGHLINRLNVAFPLKMDNRDICCAYLSVIMEKILYLDMEQGAVRRDTLCCF